MSACIRKGINIWSFGGDPPLEACFRLARAAGFEGIELALSARGALSLQTTDAEALAIRARAEAHGLRINALATGLYWQYSFTSDHAELRAKAMSVARRQLELAALLGADAALVCPGAVGVDFTPAQVVPDAGEIEAFVGDEVIPYDVAYDRALEAMRVLAPHAEATGVRVGVENIWNKFLLSPLEMRGFIDAVGSPWVGVWLDVANMLAFGYPEQWVRILGKRIVKLHFKDYRVAVGNLNGFVDLLAGDVNWREVMRALDEIGYDGWANGEMCPTYRQHTEQMIYNCSGAMEQIIGQERRNAK